MYDTEQQAEGGGRAREKNRVRTGTSRRKMRVLKQQEPGLRCNRSHLKQAGV